MTLEKHIQVKPLQNVCKTCLPENVGNDEDGLQRTFICTNLPVSLTLLLWSTIVQASNNSFTLYANLSNAVDGDCTTITKACITPRRSVGET
jgi:hypothetical protein